MTRTATSPGLSERARALRQGGRSRASTGGDRRVFYVAHPVGDDHVENAARARRWFVWLLGRYPDDALCMSWLPYVELTDDRDPESRRRGMEDDLAVLARCDGLILVGGILSPGMSYELALAQRLGLTVIDLLSLGAEPPEVAP